VYRLAQGKWPYRCATVACKTPLKDYISISFQQVPGGTPITFPAGFPQTTAWTGLLAGSVQHKGADCTTL